MTLLIKKPSPPPCHGGEDKAYGGMEMCVSGFWVVLRLFADTWDSSPSINLSFPRQISPTPEYCFCWLRGHCLLNSTVVKYFPPGLLGGFIDLLRVNQFLYQENKVCDNRLKMGDTVAIVILMSYLHQQYWWKESCIIFIQQLYPQGFVSVS